MKQKMKKSEAKKKSEKKTVGFSYVDGETFEKFQAVAASQGESGTQAFIKAMHLYMDSVQTMQEKHLDDFVRITNILSILQENYKNAEIELQAHKQEITLLKKEIFEQKKNLTFVSNVATGIINALPETEKTISLRKEIAERLMKNEQ